MWTTWAPYLKGMIGAVVGGLLLLAASHLWQDHQSLHVLISLVNQQLAQQQQARPTIAPPVKTP